MRIVLFGKRSYRKPGRIRPRLSAAAGLLLFLAALTPDVVEAAPSPKPAGAAKAGLSAAAACVAGPTTLCLNAQRFKVEVQWKDFAGNTGSGQAISLTADTGYFWFFSSSNVELVVKVVDGRALNSYFWVFFGALSNVEYTMTVTDSVTGSVKTYVNPSGTFGSVGDTAAFHSTGTATATRAVMDLDTRASSAASRALALRESLLPAGAPAPRSTGMRRAAGARAVTDAGNCIATNTSLCLNNGRFRVEVAWTDFAGNSGVGTAVGLTGDTGYFWFFSSNNVELTVKALDARTLNGDFWVFYGALSNVQYEMTVTDTLTGVVHLYSNPSGQFASVGDTSAFTAGYSVAATLDDEGTVSSVFTRSGGTLSVTGGDGTVFTLTLPEGALLSDEEITMTPVLAVDRLPLSGGLVSAVQLGPEGLRFFEPGTLVISPPSAVPVDQEMTFAWRGTGDEFILFPPDPTASDAITLSVLRLSGYGVGRGSSADQTAQQGRIPSSADDQLDQDLQSPAAEERTTLRTGGTLGSKAELGVRYPSAKTPAQIRATNALTDEFLHVLEPLLPTTCGADWKGFLLRLAQFKARVQKLTGPDATLLAGAQAYYDSVYKLLADCYNQAYDKCKADKDPRQGQEMARFYYAILRKVGPAPSVDSGKIARCLTFEMTFDSFIQEPPFPQNDPGATLLLLHTATASVPGITYSNLLSTNEGLNLTAPLKYVAADIFHPGTSKCTISTTGDDSTFTLARLDLDINLFEGDGVTSVPLTMAYDPGEPNMTITQTCTGGAPVQIISAPRWREYYGLNHSQEFKSPNFVAKNWTINGTGDIYASKKYGTALIGSETTEIDLKHTPQ